MVDNLFTIFLITSLLWIAFTHEKDPRFGDLFTCAMLHCCLSGWRRVPRKWLLLCAVIYLFNALQKGRHRVTLLAPALQGALDRTQLAECLERKSNGK